MIKIDTDECTGCAGCIDLCPTISLTLAEDRSFYKVPPCKSACRDACPLHMNVPGYLYHAKEGDYEKAYEVLRETNPLPAICGRVCYHPCEDACNRQCIDEPLSIAAMKRFISDQIDTEKLELPKIEKNGKKVAIVGSGPAGLTAAHDLALSGYDVTIFEALPEPGGMLHVGIPEYRLPNDILQKDVGYIEKLGVAIKTGTKVGVQIQLEELKKSYGATLIAIGAHSEVKLGIPGEQTTGVMNGLEFLRAVNTGEKVEVGDRVIVIGGGNSAIDAARACRRLGSKVSIMYRRSRDEMPAAAYEVEAAEKEGVEVALLAAPTKIISGDGKVSLLECVKMELGPPDESGRARPIPVKGSDFRVDADTVIAAIGQTPNPEFVKGLGLRVSEVGTIKVNENTLSTTTEGVFAGGDAVTTEPQSVVEAMASGRKTARSIDAYLKGESLSAEAEERVPEKLSEEEISALKEQFPSRKRVEMPELSSEERVKDFREVEKGYSFEQAQEESERCMTTCIFCEICAKVCPAQAISLNGTGEDTGKTV
ncbi:MAG: FAD-dependent oxidoreductase [Deltaproteobacteria bacterium]|nr:FAD-dependent oxidoreductase [Deltaproteobacteria bacterium]